MPHETRLKSDDPEVNLSWEAIIPNEAAHLRDVIFTATRGDHRVSQTATILDSMLEEVELPEGFRKDLTGKLDAIALERGWPAKLLRRLNTEAPPAPIPDPEKS